jgi:hypothetical protein
MNHLCNRSIMVSPASLAKILALMAFIIVASAPVHAQVLVITTNGEEYLGRILDDTADMIALRTTDSAEVKIPKSSVRTIQYSGVDGPTGRHSYPVLGATLGTPSGVNLLAGYSFNGWGARLSGFFLGYALFGAQLDLLKNIGTWRNFSHDIYVAAGFSQSEIYTSTFAGGFYDVTYWDYLGVGYSLNWSGFFLSAGLSVGDGTYSSPQVMGQIGYVYDFR